MKISIITVVFNNEVTISTAIESVLNQTYKDVEYIIIDGKSTDNTLEIINKYALSISRIVSEPDGGIYDAMNKGIALATGEVIGILNSDDVYADNNVLNNIMQEFNEPTIDLVYGNLVYVKNDDLNQVVRKWQSESYYPNFFEDGHVPPHPSLFLRKEVYAVVGTFNQKMRLAADYEFMLRLFKLHNFNSKYVDKLFVKMRLGGATNGSVKNIIDGNKEILIAWKVNHLKVPFLLMPKRILKRLIQFIK
ncbi:glycosyltransferase family 2 protein [Pedobacter sp. Leaf176]|uniref:glycosyltransferase family 2 protein n=1 Tax=Pedobacter sp. Leaf176 TaxID=1736286 RepID=UPI0006FB2A6A|nr:glycosyltransferase family 2 protein [Pedobacter sp. Leaf176]KQR72114.1 family 2 glycosyl transferase [Pedobacter sp. Leaf176]